MGKINLKNINDKDLDTKRLYQSYLVLLAQYSGLVQAVEPTDEELEEAQNRMELTLRNRLSELELGAKIAMERVAEEYDV